jgi:hypothetical protein
MRKGEKGRERSFGKAFLPQKGFREMIRKK